MYSTCLFCHGSLGRNEAVEHFPVGKRLAFDAEKGRLWAVCPACARWNLTPLDERWEAVEECARLFPAAERRAVTEHVVLARHPSGVELVRIGAVERRELSAWRWTREMRARRLRARALDALVAGVQLVWIAVPLSALPVRLVMDVAKSRHERARAHRPVMRVGAGSATVLAGHLDHAAVIPHEGGWALHVPDGDPTEAPDDTPALRLHRTIRAPGLTLTGDEAVRALGLAVSARNRSNRADEVEVATRMLGSTRSVDALVARTLGELANAAHYRGRAAGSVGELSNIQSVLVEMALTESTEDAALRGEVAALEAAWRDAEEIAAIADSLFLPGAVDRKLKELRRR